MKFFRPTTKRQPQKKLKEEKKAKVHYVSHNNHVSSDPDGPGVTNESKTDPVKNYSDQKTKLKESGDEDFVTDSSKKLPKLKRAPTTENKEKYKEKSQSQNIT